MPRFKFLLYVVCDMFPCKIPDVLLEFRGSQDLDVVGQSHVEPTDSFKLVHVGIEIPDIIVSLMGLDEVLR